MPDASATSVTDVPGCIFCRIAAGTAESWTVHEDAFTRAFLDIHPVADFHALVIPKAHHESLFDVPPEELLRVMATVKRVVDLYRDRLGIRNVQVVNSSGSEAQQEVLHLHVHVVPRRAGDGLDVTWAPRPQGRERFEEMIARLR